MTYAPRRIGRRPADGGPVGWSKLFTQVVVAPYHGEPMYQQKLRCFQQLDIAVDPKDMEIPHFEVSIDAALRRAAGVDAADERHYIHISPFTTSPARELPLGQVAELVSGLRRAHPQLRIALSCARVPREIEGLSALVEMLPEAPWRTWSGTLDVPGLAAVIQTAALNLSGDTGSLHVALMTGTRALAWFRTHRGQDEWIPQQPGYQVLVAADAPPRDALHGIDTPALLAAAAEILHVGRPSH
jgi:ADP-heptose:LPS heptosyltransferase